MSDWCYVKLTDTMIGRHTLEENHTILYVGNFGRVPENVVRHSREANEYEKVSVWLLYGWALHC